MDFFFGGGRLSAQGLTIKAHRWVNNRKTSGRAKGPVNLGEATFLSSGGRCVLCSTPWDDIFLCVFFASMLLSAYVKWFSDSFMTDFLLEIFILPVWHQGSFIAMCCIRMSFLLVLCIDMLFLAVRCMQIVLFWCGSMRFCSLNCNV